MKTLIKNAQIVNEGKIFKALKGQTKSKTTEKLVGCSFTELKRHLENNFLCFLKDKV